MTVTFAAGGNSAVICRPPGEERGVEEGTNRTALHRASASWLAGWLRGAARLLAGMRVRTYRPGNEHLL